MNLNIHKGDSEKGPSAKLNKCTFNRAEQEVMSFPMFIFDCLDFPLNSNDDMPI